MKFQQRRVETEKSKAQKEKSFNEHTKDKKLLKCMRKMYKHFVKCYQYLFLMLGVSLDVYDTDAKIQLKTALVHTIKSVYLLIKKMVKLMCYSSFKYRKNKDAAIFLSSNRDSFTESKCYIFLKKALFLVKQITVKNHISFRLHSAISETSGVSSLLNCISTNFTS